MVSLKAIMDALGLLSKKVEAISVPTVDASALSEIASLKASLSTVTGERDALANEIAGLKSANAAAVADLSKALDERSAFEAKVKDLEAKQESAEKKAANIVAGFGAPPLEESKKSEAATISASEFQKLSHADRNRFIRDGGKIV